MHIHTHTHACARTHIHRVKFTIHMFLLFATQHETASVDMLDYLIVDNELKKVFEKYKLYDKDITFIKELIKGEMVEVQKSILVCFYHEPWELTPDFEIIFIIQGVPKREKHHGDMSFLYQVKA